MLRLRDWKDRRWNIDDARRREADPSKSASSSTIGSGTGDGVWYPTPPPLVAGRLFRVLLRSETHFLAGPLSSVPRTLPALRGTISWNLKEAAGDEL